MLPDDGPKGQKNVGAIQRDILNTNCNILCFDKKCICWQNSLVLVKMHGITTIKVTD